MQQVHPSASSSLPQTHHRLVCVEFSKRHIYSFSHVCCFTLSGLKKLAESPVSTLIKQLSMRKHVTQASLLL